MAALEKPPSGGYPWLLAAPDVCAAALTRRSFVMAVPKRRMSRSNTRSRRSQWKATEPGLVTASVGGRQHKVPRRLLKAARLGLIDLDKR
jgi:large subunit ribosomal protein L32